MDAKFLENQDVDGIHLLTDFDKCTEIHIRLGNYAKGPTYFFPVMWPATLSTNNLVCLESEPYVVAPKPSGPRFLLYVDESGTIYLENMTQHVFRVDDSRNIKISSFDGRPIIDTVLDGIISKEKKRDGVDTDEGRLTFVIQDAIRCGGTDLVSKNILQRIAFVQVGN